MKDRLKLLIRRSLGAVGLDVLPAHKGGFHARRRLLERIRPTLVIDVGANTGQYARSLRASGYAGDILSLEPLAAPYAVLQERAAADPRWACLPVAAGDRAGPVDMFVAGNSVSSSLRPIEQRHVDAEPRSLTTGTETIEVIRLDELDEAHLPRTARVWLKVDVQGFEWEVLEGARGRLGQVEVLEIELSLTPVYAGQRTMLAMLSVIDELGFRLVWIDPVFADRQSGEMLQVDGIFVRKLRDDR